MRKLITIISIFLLIPITYAIGSAIEIFREFKKQIDQYDRAIYNRRFDYMDALSWWKIADDFTLSVFNKLLKNRDPDNYFRIYNNQNISDIRISLINNVPTIYKLGFGYNAPRPPYNADQNFSISLIPLKSDNSLFYVGYLRLWDESSNPEDWKSSPIQRMATFRILEKNALTGKYEITAKLEETNFFKKVVNPNKIKWKADVIPKYAWDGHLLDDKIIINSKGVSFELMYYPCPAGTPCYDRVYVTWLYDKRNLVAIQYRHYIEKYDWDSKTGQYISRDVTVKLSP